MQWGDMHRVCTELLLVCMCVLFVTGGVSAKLVNRIVAVVNGEIITLHELQQELNHSVPGMEQKGQGNARQSETMKRRVLEAMINDELLKQEAERFEIEVSDAEIENQISQIKSENGLSQTEFEQAVQEEGMTLDEYRQTLREEIKKNRVLGSMVRQKVVVSEEEMREYYEEHKGEYEQPKQVRLRIIVHPSRTRLEQVRKDIVAREVSFAQAARSVSQGPGADQGGALGTFVWKDLKPAWRDILSDLRPGEISRVFSLQGNYALLLLEDLADRKVQSFDELRSEIRQKIYGQKLENRYKEYIQGLREKAVISVRLQEKG